MTSIGTKKTSRGYTTCLPFFSLRPVFTRITGVPPSPHSSDGDSKFSSLSTYRPSFSNLSSHPTAGLDCFGAIACPPVVGFTIIAAEAWSPNPLQITAIVGGFVLFVSLMFLWMLHLNKKDREAAEHIRKGGEPRNFREHRDKFFHNVIKEL